MTNSFDAYLQAGLAATESGNYQEALAAFQQALKLDSRSAEAWNYQGNVLSLLELPSQALAAYDQAVALRPDYHQAWYNRGLLLQQMGAYGNALACFEQALALESDPLYVHRRDRIKLNRQLFA